MGKLTGNLLLRTVRPLLILGVILAPMIGAFTFKIVNADPGEINGQAEDNTPPNVGILSPIDKATLKPGQVIVRGNASDLGYGISRVEGFIHVLPFDNNFRFRLATPDKIDDWSTWSITLDATEEGTHRILVRATDLAGNQNWAQVLVNISTKPATVDLTPPTVKILNPSFCVPLTRSGLVLFNGIANDTESGIEKVEAFIEKAPFGQSFPFKTATPVERGDWSSWSIGLPVPAVDQPYRVLVRATDKVGNENWDEAIYNYYAPPPTRTLSEITANQNTYGAPQRVGLIDNTFTNGAYNIDGFYSFYPLYAAVESGVDITEDLFRLTANIPPNYELGSDFIPIINHMKDTLPEGSILTVMGDATVHSGLIFDNSGRNLYDILVLTHNEYVTQKEYDNLRKFVENGGTLVFLDGNIFYAEVTFDEDNCTVTLVKGHDWEFDGNSARKGVSERYFTENTEWVGSNYMINAITDNVTFANNPFDYVHFEENYVSNPNARILIDYGVTIPPDYTGDPSHNYSKIATYEMDHGKGKVIVLGLYSTNLQTNPDYLDFLEDVIMFHATSPAFKFQDGSKSIPVYWQMQSGSVENIEVDKDTRSITITVDRSSNGPLQSGENILKIALPKRIIDVSSANGTEGQKPELMVTVDGARVAYDQTEIDNERILTLRLPQATSQINIIGTKVIPEFPSIPVMIVIGVMLGVILVSTKGMQYRRWRLGS